MAAFSTFDPYKLTGVRVTDRKLGQGSYATVLELEYMGLKCAGKKIHEALLWRGDASHTVRRFEEECRLLSQIRHPNIVQFLGVYFQEGVQAPILVMEYLPTKLTSCIEQYGILPKEISYSILHDVALGLCYLHSQTPIIIHRDISSNNVLLTPNMTAKISDLGVAKILEQTRVSHMTQTPGTFAYMPPEAMVANPKYDTSIDEFSYGIMMIHMFSGRWPEPQVGQNRTEPDGRLIPVTEAERREVFLQTIGNDHPLMDLILKCVNNHPQARAHASEIVERLAEMVLQFPTAWGNRLEMRRHIEAVEEEKRALIKEVEKKDRDIQQKEIQIISLHQEEVRAKEEQKTAEIDRQLKTPHSGELELLQPQVRDLNTQSQLVTATMQGGLAELKSHATLNESQIEENSMGLIQEREQLKIIAMEREKLELALAQEREINKNLMVDIQKSRTENTTLQCTISKLQADIVGKNSDIQIKDALADRKHSEIEAKSRALEEKDATISAMSEQLTKTRESLATNIKQQVSSNKAYYCILVSWGQPQKLNWIKLH